LGLLLFAACILAQIKYAPHFYRLHRVLEFCALTMLYMIVAMGYIYNGSELGSVGIALLTLFLWLGNSIILFIFFCMVLFGLFPSTFFNIANRMVMWIDSMTLKESNVRVWKRGEWGFVVIQEMSQVKEVVSTPAEQTSNDLASLSDVASGGPVSPVARGAEPFKELAPVSRDSRASEWDDESSLLPGEGKNAGSVLELLNANTTPSKRIKINSKSGGGGDRGSNRLRMQVSKRMNNNNNNNNNTTNNNNNTTTTNTNNNNNSSGSSSSSLSTSSANQSTSSKGKDIPMNELHHASSPAVAQELEDIDNFTGEFLKNIGADRAK